MLKHDDLIGRKAFVDPATGMLWAILPDGSKEQVTFKGGIAPAYRNLVNAAIMLYVINSHVAEGLQLLSDWAEATNNERIVNAVTTYEANLHLARRCATEGLENIAATVKRG